MNINGKKRGVALVLAISAVFILLFVGIILVILARRQIGLATSLKFRTEAFANAETGIEKAMTRFRIFRVHNNDALVQAIDENRYKVGIRWFDRHPLPGYQISPRHLGGSSFEGFYYHGTSTGTKQGAERTIHFTVERVYPREW
jgi:hypothetical protein